MAYKFFVEMEVEVDEDSYTFESLGETSEDVLYEIKRMMNELDDFKLNEITVRKET